MKIEEIKNELIANTSEFLSNEGKNAAIAWLKSTVVPAAKDVAAVYTAALKEQAQKENGWNKFRDAVFLPIIIDVTLYLIGKAADKMIPAKAV